MLNEEIEKYIVNKSELDIFKYNSTFYLYDMTDIEAKIQNILNYAPSNVCLYYAMKANPHKKILELMKNIKYVKGVEIASIGEMQKALEFFTAKDILYTGPGKRYFELENAVQEGLYLINVESVTEIYRLKEIARNLDKSVDILLRVNTNYYVDGANEYMAGVSTKMGIDESKIIDVMKEIQEFDQLNIRGIHVFAASGILSYEKLTDYVEYVFKLVKRIEGALSINCSIIDFGGGFGIDYSGKQNNFDVRKFFEKLSILNQEYDFEKKDLILELGTYLVGEAGFYVAEIIDIKESKGSKHIVAAGGVNHLRLPSVSGVNQPVKIIKRNKCKVFNEQISVNDEIVDIGGPLCFAEDRLARNVYIESAEIGDLVVVEMSGAYGYTVSSLELLGHPYPIEYLYEGENNEY
jgi:diaminopimelate decarboxylase